VLTRAASTESMGGIGPSYERAAAAVYLAAMLASGAGPGLAGQVVRIAAQQPAGLDDLEIRTKDGRGRTAVARLQVKHQLALTASPSNANFAAIVADAWRDLQAAGFVAGDRVGAIAERISGDSLYAARRLNEMATLAADGAALEAGLARPGQGGDAKKLWHSVAALSEKPLGRPPTNDELLHFWRHFVIIRIEASFERDRDRAHALDQLRAVTYLEGAPDPASLFGALELIAGTLNVRGTGFDADQLRGHLAERYDITLEPTDPRLEPITRTARAAATRDAHAWRDALAISALPPEFLPLDPVGYEGDPPSPVMGVAFALGGIEAYLRRQRGLAVQGVPGAGKTQSLVQIATHLLETTELIPIVRKLPRLALGGQPILDGIASDPFHTIGRDALALLARTGRLVLLLDGWNELGHAQRDWAWEALAELRRLYPNVLLVMTTRSGTVRPYGAEMRLELAAFDRDRQLEAAELQHGSEGRQLLIRARAQANLRPLLRIPLFLTAILAQARSGTLPTDRESAIRQLIEVAKGEPKLREAMRAALDGQQHALLEDLGWALMQAESTAIGEDQLLPLITASLGRLRAAHKLFVPVAAPQALDQLLADSILTANGEPGSRDIGFSHQLLQEWFASHAIDPMIAGADQATPTSLLAILDAPFWGASLLFSVERLARDNANAAALRALVSVTLGIEPFLAAEMLQRMPEAAKAPLDPLLDAFATAWLSEQQTRAARFMFASGRPQFSDNLWRLMEEQGELAFDLRSVRHRFPLDALLPAWDAHFAALGDQTRRVLLIDIIDQGDPAGLDRVVSAALSDPEPDVVSGVIDYLDFHDERIHLNDLLARLDAETGRRIARGRRPGTMNDANRTRWDAWRRERFDTAEGVEWIDLAIEYDLATAEAVVEALLALKLDNSWSAQGIYERVAARDAAVLANALAERLRKGERIPSAARPWLTKAPADTQQLIAILTGEDSDWQKRTDAARLLKGDAIGGILDELLAASSNQEFRRDKRLARLAAALEHTQFELLAGQILARDASNAGEIFMLADTLANWKSGSDDTPLLPIAPGMRAALDAKLPDWTARMIADAEGPRFWLVSLGRLIGRMGRDQHLSLLLELVEEDRARLARQRAARDAAPGGVLGSEANMGYDNQYQKALIRIGGDAVIAAMIERFPDPAWEADAASVLSQLLAVEPRRTALFGPQRDDMTARRASLAEFSLRPPDPAAAIILDRVDELTAHYDTASIVKALHLAGHAMQMNYGNRGASLRRLLDVGREASRFPDYCKALAERGELLPAALVHDEIDREAQAVEAMQWCSENDLWKLKLWIRLAAFADDPAAALPDPSKWPKQVRLQNGHQDLLYALGYSPSTSGPLALEKLRQADPLALFGDTWARALAEIGSDDAANVLLNAIDTTPVDSNRWHDTHGMRAALEKLIVLPAPRARAFAMLETLSDQPKLGVIASAIVETMDESDAIRLLELADPQQHNIIGKELASRLENAAVTRIPVPDMANSYELESKPLPALRKRAFELLRRGAPSAHHARLCLRSIDELRDQYGKPSAEPNHPDLGTRMPWPEAAQVAWRNADFG
jgi:hypothetical protein